MSIGDIIVLGVLYVLAGVWYFGRRKVQQQERLIQEQAPYPEVDKRVKLKNTCIPRDEDGRTVPEIVFAPKPSTTTPHQTTPEKVKVRC